MNNEQDSEKQSEDYLRPKPTSTQSRAFAHFGVLDSGAQSKVSLFTSVALNFYLAFAAILLGSAGQVVRNSSIPGKVFDAFGTYGTAALSACVVLIVGGLAHWFKKNSQYYYGLVEVVFAGATAWNIGLRLPTEKALFSQWFALIAATYIVARGRNNMADGKAKAASHSVHLAE